MHNFTVVVEAAGAHHEFGPDSQLVGEWILNRVQTGLMFPVEDIDSAIMVVDCDVHGYGFVYNGMCEACYDDQARDEADRLMEAYFDEAIDRLDAQAKLHAAA